MSLLRERKGLVGGILLVLAAVVAWVLWPSASIPQAPGSGEVVMAFGVGGVLTRDGALWQYRLDTRDWVTIDQAFEDQGQDTHILPLPVRVSEISSMESFGFIITRGGDCWLYDLEEDKWENVGRPSGR